MHQILNLHLKTKAIPKARSRHTSFNGISRHYTPATTAKFERLIAESARPHCSVPSDKPIKLVVNFEFAMSESSPKYYKDNMSYLGHTIKPDLDNLVKSIKDGLNTIAWVDDSQVIAMAATKSFGATDNIYIYVFEMPVLTFTKRLKANFLKLIGKEE